MQNATCFVEKRVLLVLVFVFLNLGLHSIAWSQLKAETELTIEPEKVWIYLSGQAREGRVSLRVPVDANAQGDHSIQKRVEFRQSPILILKTNSQDWTQDLKLRGFQDQFALIESRDTLTGVATLYRVKPGDQLRIRRPKPTSTTTVVTTTIPNSDSESKKTK